MLKKNLIVSIIVVLCSCNTNGNDIEAKKFSVEISPTELNISYKASTQTLTITANSDWAVYSDSAWCNVSPSGGVAGTSTVTVKIGDNTNEKSRSTNLVFKSGTAKQTYTITQNYYVKEVPFTDDNFKKYCIKTFDSNGDGLLSTSEVAKVTDLNVSGLGIKTMDGLESFTGLHSLNCSKNQISVLNVSALNYLTSIDCSSNELASLDIQSNYDLSNLDCTNNSSLKAINVWAGFTETSSFRKPDNAQYVMPDISGLNGYTLVWHDEFNDAHSQSGKAALPNTSRWWYETGNGGWGNNEIQNYISAVSGTDSTAFISNGSLKIKAMKSGSQVLSARMNTTVSWTYGYFEARLKLPKGKGTWPAFWMMPKNFKAWPDDGEIDIMEEVGYNPGWVSSSIHCKAYYHSIGTQKTAAKYISTAESEYHVYGLEWTADYIKGYIDGVSYFEFKNDGAGNYNTWPFYNPFYLKLNLAWGGDWGGSQGVDESKLPATYEIDYVRVFQKK